MDPIKVMSVFGTRPEAIKMCPLVRKLEEQAGIQSIVCVTGQHREMLDHVLSFFGVHADYDLNIMKPSQTLTSITADILAGLSPVLEETKPDLLLVHGDTTTSMAAALAAFYHKIPIGHVEAGLRTGDRYSPYPEEMNRQLTGRLAAYHFAPTQRNRDNLAREGITDHVYVTGNTVIDTFAYTIRDGYVFESPQLAPVRAHRGPVITLTAHRRENQDGGIEQICRAAIRIAQRYPDTLIVYPVHLSPAVRNTVFPLLSGIENILLCDPVGLCDMHNLMAISRLVLTDSGGIQEEAPSLGVPVLVLRSETERPEAVEAGTVRVIGTDADRIVAETTELLENEAVYTAMTRAVNPYGDGKASERIVEMIKKEFKKRDYKH